MKSLILIFVAALCQLGSTNYPSKLRVSVYYESKCPDSQRFITKQLAPAIEQLQDHLILTLVPFGKADSIAHGSGGFRCQHGPSECLGNLFQDCSLYHMQDRSYVDRVAYVACEMESRAGTTGNYMCVNKAKIPAEDVRQCVSSEEGIELQLQSEHATKLIKPKFVPTITVNDEFNQEVQDNALVNFFGTVCLFISNAEPCRYQAYQYTVL